MKNSVIFVQITRSPKLTYTFFIWYGRNFNVQKKLSLSWIYIRRQNRKIGFIRLNKRRDFWQIYLNIKVVLQIYDILLKGQKYFSTINLNIFWKSEQIFITVSLTVHTILGINISIDLCLYCPCAVKVFYDKEDDVLKLLRSSSPCPFLTTVTCTIFVKERS